MNLPESFQEQMKRLLKEEYEDYIHSFEQTRVYGLRVNTSKISTEQFEQLCPFSIHKIPWTPNGYYYEGTEKPAKHPYYFAGLYYLQEPSAMTPAHLLPIEPGDRVLDVCAAPGGKSTELAAKLNGTGLLVSNDISNSRAKALLKNLELFGVSNAIVMSESPHKLADRFPQYFDKILIDAPCSGEGMFRKEPAVIKSWLEHGNEFYAKLQREIVTDALKMLRPGGMLLYSTCTFSPLENEATVQYMMEICPELEIVPVERYEGFGQGLSAQVNGDESLKECVRIWPHKMKGEGHFLVLLKKGEGSREPRKTKKETPAKFLEKQQELAAFLKNTTIEFDNSRLEMRGEKVVYLSECEQNLNGLRIMRSGLLLGECKKNRFEPSQAFAMALKKEQYKQVIDFSISDPRVIKYLKGETLEVDDLVDRPLKGWQLICVDGYPLGFAKANRTILKNKYLAGWRWQ
ncbi:MAG: RsmB/NOP family class I SAM-dependent RNA methyltransferase [Clostridiales bacterium]|nr:RsmB/NOP family class I SAM-dependent RNA methyltransferase [Clostridiales bacterium]